MAKGADWKTTGRVREAPLETEGQVERLGTGVRTDRRGAQGKTCPAINGILEEGSEMLRNTRALRRLTPA